MLLALFIGLSGCVQPPATPAMPPVPTRLALTDDSVNSATYTLDGKAVTLVNGEATVEAAPGSAEKVTTKYDLTQRGDINGDDLDDAAAVLVQTGAGSGSFYYLAACIGAEGGCKGSNAILLGDRVVIQSLSVSPGGIKVVFMDHKDGASLAEPPTETVTESFVFNGTELVEQP